MNSRTGNGGAVDEGFAVGRGVVGDLVVIRTVGRGAVGIVRALETVGLVLQNKHI